jgi:hypothetical protein
MGYLRRASRKSRLLDESPVARRSGEGRVGEAEHLCSHQVPSRAATLRQNGAALQRSALTLYPAFLIVKSPDGQFVTLEPTNSRRKSSRGLG